MDHAESTCWTLIRGAAHGSVEDQDVFARRYRPVVEAYLRARWRSGARSEDVDDAVQEVFLDCLRQGGALERADAGRPGGFRAFLAGVVRNVALRFEASRRRIRELQPWPEADLGSLRAYEAHLSRVFDRAWADVVLQDALDRCETWARARGEHAVVRLAILRERTLEGLPIREIAGRRDLDPAVAHHEYARARKDFRKMLSEALAFHLGVPVVADGDLRELLALVSARQGTAVHPAAGRVRQ